MTAAATALILGLGRFRPGSYTRRLAGQRRCMRRLRARRRAAGLTSAGTPRRNRSFPQLAGLTGRPYHTAYMHIRRNTKLRHA